MLFALLLSVFFLGLYRVRLNLKGYHEDYMAKYRTDAVKGLFILLVFLSHSLKYICNCGYQFNAAGDSLFNSFFMGFTQLVVVMFLFYSGYGVCESFKRNGLAYAKKMPRHRLLGTLLNYDIAVIIFVVVSLLLGIGITLNQGLVALTSWDTVGIDNWYIFVILLCYLMSYLALRFGSMKIGHRALLLLALCLLCVFVLSLLKTERWYNTLLCYPLGFLYSAHKAHVEAFLKNHYWLVLIAFVVSMLFIFGIFMMHVLPNLCQLPYNIFCMIFAMIVVMLTMKVGIANPFLTWAGTHLFPIFIYMRLPMIFLQSQTPILVGTYPALFILISLTVTLLIARAYKYWEIRL